MIEGVLSAPTKTSAVEAAIREVRVESDMVEWRLA